MVSGEWPGAVLEWEAEVGERKSMEFYVGLRVWGREAGRGRRNYV